MILLDDDRKESLSLKFIRNMLNMSIYDFANECDVDSSLISKMESANIRYLFKYKKVLLKHIGIKNACDNRDIYFNEINEVLNIFLYKDSISALNELKYLNLDLIFSSKYFLDFYLLAKIISVSTFSRVLTDKLENDKFESIILKMKDYPSDTNMLINIYLLYKHIFFGCSVFHDEIYQQYKNIGLYSHYVLYLMLIDQSANLIYDEKSAIPARLALHYKNIVPNRRSRQIISIVRSINWLKNPSTINYKKLISSQRKYCIVCAENLKAINLYSIISINFISGAYDSVIINMNEFSNHFDNDCDGFGEHLFFMAAISAHKINDQQNYKLYLNRLKNRSPKNDVKYIIEIVEKYPIGKSIKRPIERQIKKLFSNRKPINILMILLEYNKLYDISEFDDVRNFLTNHPQFKLF